VGVWVWQDECDAAGTEWVWNWSSRPEVVPQRSVRILLVVIRVPTLANKKILGLSKTIKTFFQDLLGARQCLTIKTNSNYLPYIRSVIH